MGTSRLEAWLGDEHVGTFVRDASERLSFSYDDDAASTPVSLSLPRYRPHARRAADRYLENLLPDHAETRRRMAGTVGARSTDVLAMLAIVGADVAGGLVLLPEGEAPAPTRTVFATATDRDIAHRIASIKQDPDTWLPSDAPARFTLAGTQGKFALTKVDGEWHWPNAGVPSTHILKPGPPRLEHVQELEVETLQLAREVGVAAPHAEILEVGGQNAFVIERFDREAGADGVARRVHAEDLAQSRWVSPGRKYEVSAGQVISTLNEVDASHRLATEFIRQLAFNTIVSNADAHAKNYSVLLHADRIDMAPLYDSLALGLYGKRFDQRLAMPITGARYPQAVTPDHWRRLATKAGLDDEPTMYAVTDVARRVAERLPDAWPRLPTDSRDLLRQAVERNVASTLGEPRGTRT